MDPRVTLLKRDRAMALEQLERVVGALELSPSPPDCSIYGSLLRRCGIAGALALAHGRRIHALMIKHGAARDEFLANSLLQMYGKCSSVDAAFDFFRAMDARNQFSWNIMLTAFSRAGDLDRAERLFTEMPQRDVASWTALLAAYAGSYRLRDAQLLFDRMPLRNVVSWNAMLSALAGRGDLDRALTLFRVMDLEGVHPDRVSFIAILDACGARRAVDLGLSIHAELLHAGFQAEITVVTALVEMYGRCGRIEDARGVFDRVRVSADAVLWAAMLAAYAQTGHPRDARDFFDAIPGRHRSSVAWTMMISAYARGGDLDAARAFFDRMPRSGSVVPWNAMITGYAQSVHHRRGALLLFRAMDLEGIAPDSVTFSAVLDSCSSVAQGKLLHSILVDQGRGLSSNFAVQTALVAMYGNFGHLDDAKRVFDGLKHCDIKSWSSMVAAYAQNGHTGNAVHLFRLMQLQGWTPSGVTLISVLLACSHAGSLVNAYFYFVSLSSDYGIVPGLDHYMSIVDVLARSGRLNEADELIRVMPFEPDAIAWTALLSASSAAGDSHTAEKAAECVFELDPNNAAPYTLLSNVQSDQIPEKSNTRSIARV